MEDLVRRCDVIEALTTPEECETDGDRWRMYPPSHAEILNRIERLPSVSQEPVNPIFIDGKRNHFIKCGNCNTNLMRGMKFCSCCGRAVKWDG